jgi:hypothetical protein
MQQFCAENTELEIMAQHTVFRNVAFRIVKVTHVRKEVVHNLQK